MKELLSHKSARSVAVLCAAVALSLACTRATPATPASTDDTEQVASLDGSLRVLTWNISLRDFLLTERRQAMRETLLDSDADVIALQEVTPNFYLHFLADEELRDEYAFVPTSADQVKGRLAILTRLPVEQFEYLPLPGRMGRVAQRVAVSSELGTIDLLNLHLESYLDDNRIRANQLKAIHGKFNTPAILCGDFNFGDGPEAREEHSAIPEGFRDAWLELHPEDPGYTWNQEENPLALQFRFDGEVSRRIDRILFQSPEWKTVSVEMVAVERSLRMNGTPVPPSDHYGVLAEFGAR